MNKKIFIVFCLLLSIVVTAQTDSSEWQGFKIEKMYIPANDGSKIPFILLKPNAKKKTYSCVLMLHGITSAKEREWLVMDNFPSGGNLTLKLLNAGYAVAAIDARMHGERNNKKYKDDEFEKHFGDLQPHWNSIYNDTIDDIVVCLNYLKNRKDMKKNNIGILGYSMGGGFSLKLAAVNPDLVKTIVACVPPVFDDEQGKTSCQYYTPEIKIPVLMLVGNNDEWTPLERSKWAFDMIPSKKKKIVVYESSHQLPLKYTDEAVKWLKKYL